jgi:lipopolysaccharide exporter
LKWAFSLKDKLTTGVFWLGSAKILVNILALLSTLILARFLTPYDFGVFAIATTVLTVVASLTELSLSSALIHHENPSETHFQTAWTLNLLRALFIAVVLCVSAPVLARFYNEPNLVSIMLSIAFGVAFLGLFNPKMIILTRRLIFWQEFVLTVGTKCIGFVVGTSVAFIYKSYWALVAGMLVSQVVGVLISYVIIPFKPRITFEKAQELWSFSVWLSLCQMINMLNMKLDYLIIGGLPGKSTLGYYSVGENLASLPTKELTGPIEATLFPGFARIGNDRARLKQAYKTSQSLIVAIAFPAGIGCAFIAHPLVLLGLGDQWLPAVEVIQILACVYALQSLGAPVQSLSMAKGQTRLLFIRDITSFAIRAPCALVGFFINGLTGILYARAASNIIAIIINLLLARQLLGLGVLEQIFSNIRSIISVLIMSASIACFQYFVNFSNTPLDSALNIAFSAILGIISYTIVHILLWSLSGRPSGPETEVFAIILKLSLRLKIVKGLS